MEKGITDYEVVAADIATGSHRPPQIQPYKPALTMEQTPEFMQKSPFGQVPLEPDDTPLIESRAIARVLATKYSDVQPSLIPDYANDPKAFVLFEQALLVKAMKVDPYARPLIHHKLVAP